MTKFEFKHRYQPKEEQIYHTNWSDPNAPKDYFRTISDIAYLIGKLLEHNDYTIKVHQFKEKFGGVRVYCEFGYEDKNENTLESFKEDLKIADAAWYREVYFKIYDLFPQYYDAIRWSADFPGLLCHTKEELDELIDSKYYAGWGFDKNLIEEVYKICGFDKQGKENE